MLRSGPLASSHKAPAIRNAIRAVGARLLFLPAGSPDLNPIEHIRAFTRTKGVHALKFAKLKHLLRKAAGRSRDSVWRRVGTLPDPVAPQECENHLKYSGYGSS